MVDLRITIFALRTNIAFGLLLGFGMLAAALYFSEARGSASLFVGAGAVLLFTLVLHVIVRCLKKDRRWSLYAALLVCLGNLWLAYASGSSFYDSYSSGAAVQQTRKLMMAAYPMFVGICGLSGIWASWGVFGKNTKLAVEEAENEQEDAGEEGDDGER